MAIFKCKMCGGSLEVQKGQTICECEYCGTKQTVSATDDEVVTNLYNRANNLRIKCEFDKAQEIYEKIVAKNPNEAEAYWGIVLCKYGIEYVEDPNTYKRVPTCHRTQLESVLTDVDYLSAIENADSNQKLIYEQEAKEIDKLQKDILSIVHKEKPFDVFICYKETDENGKRTVDSVLANDIYYQLTQEGLKVFYAAITLENKLGQEYEPYIFAALNSAKVMLVVGTKPENFNAVWVKNEWSRYLKLMSNDRSKTLIPCFRDMDAYDLPDEFSHLQAQDMSKIGFINDVVRGIKKLIVTEEPRKQETVVINQTANANIEPLLKRAFIFLEDKDWDSANEYAEKVLDQEPENAQAYLVKLMAELKISKQDDLRNCEEPFADKANFEKICRYDSVLGEQLKADIALINERNENTRLENLYQNAIDTARKAYSEEEHKAASKNFDEIIDYKDSKKHKEQCLVDAEDARKRSIYERAKSGIYSRDVERLKQTVSLFDTIPNYRDSNELLKQSKQKIVEIEKQNEEDRIRKEKEAEEKRIREEKLAEERRIAVEKKAKKTKIIGAIIAVITILAIVLGMVYVEVIQPRQKLSTAMTYLDSGDYENAYALLEELGDNETIAKSKYDRAVELINKKDIEGAYLLLENLDYKDSNDILSSITPQYQKIILSKSKAGDFVIFGIYASEEIEWQVLDRKNDKILIISKKIIECKQYNDEYTDTTWEKCSLRTWLNDDFYKTAFDENEKSSIQTTTVVNKDNELFNTKGGNDTKDKIFLLSIDEANKYFTSAAERKCQGTNYAKSNGLKVNDYGENEWWLRSPGIDQDYATIVEGGAVRSAGTDVINIGRGVRPAMWINISE